MTISPPSNSERPANPAAAFSLLHPGVQQWIWSQNWQSLRETQARAVEPILAAETDVIISATTASGKTEAAWLPICSRLGFDADEGKATPGVKSLCISPLKALINDQYDRLLPLAASVDLPAYRRHGDVAGSERSTFTKQPDGLVLTTPESLEAMFVNQGANVSGIFGGLRYIVIDELHSFIGTERGAQLQSLLHRIELAVRRRVVRVGLSATLADLRVAADFMRPREGGATTIIDGSGHDTGEVRVQLRGYRISQGTSQDKDDVGSEDGSKATDTHVTAIAEHIYTNLRTSDNLVFANSRSNVEIYTDVLRQICRTQRTPEVFHPHHGSLSRELREVVERLLKASDTPATAICTSTLEMGIDIGSADSVAQIGPPGSVAALRQRLGRSGRRGDPAVLRLYIAEQDLRDSEQLGDRLRMSLVESIATVELMLVDRWYEPPGVAGLHLSTLIQQVLSVIAQHGGASAAQLFGVLCGHGPFVHVTRPMFTRLLRDLGEREVILQAGDGLLLPGRIGDKLVNHYTFYIAFQTSQEYRLIADSRSLGTLPIDFPLIVNDFLIFAGRRWKIVSVDETAQIVILTAAAGGKPPLTGGTRGRIADGIRIKMRDIYTRTDVPTYLTSTAASLLAEARTTCLQHELLAAPIRQAGSGCQIVAFRGDLVLDTLAAMLFASEIPASSEYGIITVPNIRLDFLRQRLEAFRNDPAPDPLQLAGLVKAKQRDKYDGFLGDDLLASAYAARDLDVTATIAALPAILGSGTPDRGDLAPSQDHR